jgi:hypothetical protein
MSARKDKQKWRARGVRDVFLSCPAWRGCPRLSGTPGRPPRPPDKCRVKFPCTRKNLLIISTDHHYIILTFKFKQIAVAVNYFWAICLMDPDI